MINQKFNVSDFVAQMSLLLDLQIHDEYQDGVVANFEIIKSMAEIVNNFPLPEETEISPTFEP
ncbi:DUF4089 domain-containing protein [Anabaena sp. UHCC 0451]|uniref:DUF4089 domain-containing protein n=1 Tax=Anabaena sp. UHCC 0451 TaxID=2055235 RepID=UPI002B1F2F29|nr:DUF4089 domain-containing protein [Anabaena sp. UHCC 0451]MEA5579552.1 DUF4089 domain-containing protein [Anabaena sp. UHCC 0451]